MVETCSMARVRHFPAFLLSWENLCLFLHLNFPICEVKGLGQINPKSTVSMNILGYLSSVWPDLAAIGRNGSTQQFSALLILLLSKPSTASHTPSQVTKPCPATVCTWYKVETIAALFPLSS